MTDNQFLFMVIVLLYLSECFIWVNSKGIAFRKTAREWSAVFASALFGNESGGLALAYPLPFLGRCYMTYLLPVSFSPEGIVNSSIEALTQKIPKVSADQTFYAYKDIVSVESKGNFIIINNDVFCKCGSTPQAKSLSDTIHKLLTQDDKTAGIKEYYKSILDNNNVNELENKLDNKTKILSVLCNVQFSILFIIAPAIVYVFGSVFIIWSGIYLVLSNICLIVMYYFIHKELSPELTKDRITDSLKMFFCPPLTIRAVDIISLPYLSTYHPIAVAYTTLDEHKFQSLANQVVLSYNFPYELIKDTEFNQTLKWHLDSINESVKAFLSQIGLDVEKIYEAPERSDNTSSFCPRCHTQFTLENGQCPECTGVVLIGYTGISHAENKQ